MTGAGPGIQIHPDREGTENDHVFQWDRILDLNCLIKQGGRITETQDDSLVIVSPTYAWRLPRIVEQSVRNAELHPRCRAWFVMTCGDEIGNAGR